MATLADIAANNLRGERGRRRLTQEQLAALLGWPKGAVYDAENGRRRLTIDDFAALCRALDVPLVDLLRGADDDDLRALGLR